MKRRFILSVAVLVAFAGLVGRVPVINLQGIGGNSASIKVAVDVDPGPTFIVVRPRG